MQTIRKIFIHKRHGASSLLFIPCSLILLIGNAFMLVAQAQSQDNQTPIIYTVKAGDTLYSISQKHGVDYKVVAQRNDLGSDFAIQPGQQLVLKGEIAPPKAASEVATSRGPSPKTWLWPTRSNDIIAHFAENEGVSSKGIDIAGVMNQLILSTAAGKVIYAGRGMYRDYGNLIIINHGGRYSSVYGHNSEMLIREGDTVKAGDPIARMGATGADSVKLHFQIRRAGDALDPLSLVSPPNP